MQSDTARILVFALAVLIPTIASAQQARVFITSTSSDGNLGGLAGADSTCNARATAGSLGGTWVAWLSDGSTNAVDRLKVGSGPFVLATSSTQVANDIADLTDGSIANAIDEDESGSSVVSGVWTGTVSDGTVDAGLTCSDWTSGSNGSNGRAGTSASVSVLWTQWTFPPCDNDFHLYCFEIPPDTPVPSLRWYGLGLVAVLLTAIGAYQVYRAKWLQQ